MPDYPRKTNGYLLPVPYSLRIRNQLLDLSRPKVMAILNVSPDSFYSGSRFTTGQGLAEKARKLLEDGAEILDLGAMSSRPGSKEIPEQKETELLLPALRLLKKEFPTACISVDTFRSGVARIALGEGADIVNDISGGIADPEILKIVAATRAPYILMHSRGLFPEMHRPQTYPDLIPDIVLELRLRISAAREAGIQDIVVDPGFGFSKSREQNFALLRGLHALEILDCPVLAGISRKSMIFKTLGIEVEEALNGTTALHMVALQQGAHILRVHDVKEAVQTIQLFEKLCLPES